MIVGISGLAGSGKDTVADILRKEHGFAKVSFADPMKRFCAEVFGFTEDQLWGPSASRNAADPRYPRAWENAVVEKTENVTTYGRGAPTAWLTPRYALQRLGTEWGRDCYEDVWIEYAIGVARRLLAKGGQDYEARSGIFPCVRPPIEGVAFPDVRFHNEMDLVRRAGGKLLRIVRPGAGLKGAAASHQSESEQAEIPDDAFDVVIENTGTLERLAQQVRSSLVILDAAVRGIPPSF